MCKVKEFVFIYLLISVFCGCSHKNDIQFQRDFSSFLNVPLSTEGFNYLINNSTNHGLEKIQVIYGKKELFLAINQHVIDFICLFK